MGKIRNKWLCLTLYVIGMVLLCLVCVEWSLRAVAREYALARGRMIANDAVNQACLEEDFATWYDQLVHITRDENGNVQSVEIDGFALNQLSGRIAQRTRELLTQAGEEPVRIPFAGVLGIQAVGVKGPAFVVSCRAVPAVDTQLYSQFVSAGINQTNHRITAKVDVLIRFILAGQSVDYNFRTDTILCETLIVGTVPDTYLQNNGQSQVLPLVPTEP